MRKAVIYGSVLASFCVEAFSLERLRKLTHDEIADRYQMWEDSINAVLLIMRKMQATTTENTKLLINSIVDFHERVRIGLEKFEKKRNSVEKYSGADLWGTVKQLKRVMGILKLQIQEYELKSRVDTYLKYIAGLSG